MSRQGTKEGQTIEKLNEIDSVDAISHISDFKDCEQKGAKTSRDVGKLSKRGADETCLLFSVFLTELDISSYQYTKLNFFSNKMINSHSMNNSGDKRVGVKFLI